MRRTMIMLAFANIGTAAFAQAPAAAAQTCPAVPAPLPAELAAFRSSTPLAASTGQPTGALLPGKAASIALRPNATLAFPVAPAHPGTEGTFGGVVGLTIAEAGTYRVALGAGAWLEVVRDGSALKSVAHDHGPACSGVRKLVDFALMPGSYLVELAGNRDPQVTVMVVRLR